MFTDLPNERWAVFISGRGSNLAAALEAAPHNIQLVMSNDPNAVGLKRARRAGVATLVMAKPINWAEVTRSLRQRQITTIFLLGFMRILPADFVQEWQGRIINLHPSLLPAYPGLKSIERAFADEFDLGATVHEVTAEVDAGNIILQRRSLKASEFPSYSLRQAEWVVHRDEQRLVRETCRQWRVRRKNQPTS